MEIERSIKIETVDIQISDRIHVDHYTATCQEITPKGALFLLDQYLDESMAMNWRNTNSGGYTESDLRKALQSEEVLNIFKDIRGRMIPFENGDLLRIPFAGEMYGNDLPSWCERDDHEQWPLMKDVHNRISSRCGAHESGWLQNKTTGPSTDFCMVSDGYGNLDGWYASHAIGVRPVFQIVCESITEDGDEKRNKYKRLIDRLAELDDLNRKIGRLRFYLNENMDDIDSDAMNVMLAQFSAMAIYRNKLQFRIENGWY